MQMFVFLVWLFISFFTWRTYQRIFIAEERTNRFLEVVFGIFWPLSIPALVFWASSIETKRTKNDNKRR